MEKYIFMVLLKYSIIILKIPKIGVTLISHVKIFAYKQIGGFDNNLI